MNISLTLLRVTLTKKQYNRIEYTAWMCWVPWSSCSRGTRGPTTEPWELVIVWTLEVTEEAGPSVAYPHATACWEGHLSTSDLPPLLRSSSPSFIVSVSIHLSQPLICPLNSPLVLQSLVWLSLCVGSISRSIISAVIFVHVQCGTIQTYNITSLHSRNNPNRHYLTLKELHTSSHQEMGFLRSHCWPSFNLHQRRDHWHRPLWAVPCYLKQQQQHRHTV